MIFKVIPEGFILGILLVIVCAAGIRNGAVGMVFLYSPKVQKRSVELGQTTYETIRRNKFIFKAICIPGYISYVLICAYAVNGARNFPAGFFMGKIGSF